MNSKLELGSGLGLLEGVGAYSLSFQYNLCTAKANLASRQGHVFNAAQNACYMLLFLRPKTRACKHQSVNLQQNDLIPCLDFLTRFVELHV